jgi:hypothetical protein
MKRITPGLTAIALGVVTATLCQAQPMPTVRQLGPVTAVGKEALGAVTTVRALPDGRVLVNDIVGRRVLMFDSTLSTTTVVADTTSATANAYGTRPGGLIAYRGDSSLFIDPASLSMLLIDPNGKIGRVMSAPRAQDVGFLIGGPFGSPGFDSQGRLVYRAPPRFMFTGPPPSGNRPPQPPQIPDSAALVRFDLATRKLDTVTWFKTPKVSFSVVQAPDGGMRVTSVMNPLPQGDDWTMLSDGSIAIVRGRDYHVDWVGAQGITSSPKIPYEWERMSDEQKVAFIDSAKVAIEKARASGQFSTQFASVAIGSGAIRTNVGSGAPRDSALRADPQRDSALHAGAPRDGSPRQTITTDAPQQVPTLTMIAPNELPDYKPAFTPGSTRADADGNLWIRTSHNVDGRPVYDVVNRKGELVDRVQLPLNRQVAGFGPNGVVYLGVRDGRTAHLEKARIR